MAGYGCNISNSDIETDSPPPSSSSDESFSQRARDDSILAAHKNASSPPPCSSSDELPWPSRGRRSILENDKWRKFKCSTCNKRFASFQALGGHTGHCRRKKMKMNAGKGSSSSTPAVSGQNIYKCSACSKEFSSGAALGGHMRKHSA